MKLCSSDNHYTTVGKYLPHERVNEKGVIMAFVADDKLNTFNILNKNTVSPKRIMVLRCM